MDALIEELSAISRSLASNADPFGGGSSSPAFKSSSTNSTGISSMHAGSTLRQQGADTGRFGLGLSSGRRHHRGQGRHASFMNRGSGEGGSSGSASLYSGIRNAKNPGPATGGSLPLGSGEFSRLTAANGSKQHSSGVGTVSASLEQITRDAAGPVVGNSGLLASRFAHAHSNAFNDEGHAPEAIGEQDSDSDEYPSVLPSMDKFSRAAARLANKSRIGQQRPRDALEDMDTLEENTAVDEISATGDAIGGVSGSGTTSAAEDDGCEVDSNAASSSQSATADGTASESLEGDDEELETGNDGGGELTDPATAENVDKEGDEGGIVVDGSAVPDAPREVLPPEDDIPEANDGNSTHRGPEEVLPPPRPLFKFGNDEISNPFSPSWGPLTGTVCKHVLPAPEFVWKCPATEPLIRQPDGIIARMQMHDARRVKPGVGMSKVVYDCLESAQTPQYTPVGESDVTLQFESRFESGNLRRAIQVFDYEYDLILRPDINTKGHTQWFYFKVMNTKAGCRYKFNIVNMMKPDSLYNQGLCPLMYSKKHAEATGFGWQRAGEDVCYYQNQIKRKSGNFYTLTFSLVAEHADDELYFAHCYPYTYSDLQKYLWSLEQDPQRSGRIRRRLLAQTLAGNSCDVLTITSFSSDPKQLKARRGMVISARVHPGETNASWMMKGLIDYLTGPSLDAKILRDNFVFKIIPMLNPDGVIVGNYRCSLSGQDLNRQWLEPHRRMHPTVVATKNMIKCFQEDRPVVMFCDMHGHSRKKNIFIYGCNNKTNSPNRLQERVFPRILWRNAQAFSYDDCSFKVQKCKESTARVVVWREFGITNSYTMEASFCGPSFGQFANTHFSPAHLEAMGHYFCDTILDYWDPDQSKVNGIFKELLALNDASAPGLGEDSDVEAAGEGKDESDSDFSDDDQPTKSLRKRRKGKDGKRKTSKSKGSGNGAIATSKNAPSSRSKSASASSAASTGQAGTAISRSESSGSSKTSGNAKSSASQNSGVQAKGSKSSGSAPKRSLVPRMSVVVRDRHNRVRFGQQQHGANPPQSSKNRKSESDLANPAPAPPPGSKPTSNGPRPAASIRSSLGTLPAASPSSTQQHSSNGRDVGKMSEGVLHRLELLLEATNIRAGGTINFGAPLTAQIRQASSVRRSGQAESTTGDDVDSLGPGYSIEIK